MVGATLLTKVTVAVPVPPGPVAVTVSLPVAVMVTGAVYRPALVIVPDVADQEVVFVPVKGWFAPKARVTAAGDTTGAGVVVPPPVPPVPPVPPPELLVTGIVMLLLGLELGFEA